MAKISVHDVEVRKEEKNLRVKGSATIRFTSTEVRLDVSFHVRVLAYAKVKDGNVQRWLLHYYSKLQNGSRQHNEGGKNALQACLQRYPSAEMNVGDITPSGNASIDIPFEIVCDMSELWNRIWLAFKPFNDTDFLTKLMSEVTAQLYSEVNATVSPDICGGNLVDSYDLTQ